MKHKTKLTDKYLVRDYVRDKIGEKYLINLLGVYNKFEDIELCPDCAKKHENMAEDEIDESDFDLGWEWWNIVFHK